MLGSSSVFAGAACARKRSEGASAVVALFARSVPRSTMLREAEYACSSVHTETCHPNQARVTPSPQARRGRSVNRIFVRAMVAFVRDEKGVKESVDILRSFRPRRICLKIKACVHMHGQDRIMIELVHMDNRSERIWQLNLRIRVHMHERNHITIRLCPILEQWGHKR